jgi:predicted kinase
MEKELILLRGLPGSGKSTFARSLGGMHMEADKYFMYSGKYEFDASKLRDAHNWCQNAVRVGMETQGQKIVVSNTFTQENELEPYYKLAERYGYRVYSLIVENRHGESENTNTHNVPLETIQKMRGRFQIKL